MIKISTVIKNATWHIPTATPKSDFQKAMAVGEYVTNRNFVRK